MAQIRHIVSTFGPKVFDSQNRFYYIYILVFGPQSSIINGIDKYLTYSMKFGKITTI